MKIRKQVENGNLQHVGELTEKNTSRLRISAAGRPPRPNRLCICYEVVAGQI